MKIQWIKPKDVYTYDKAGTLFTFHSGEIMEIDNTHFLFSELRGLTEHCSGPWIKILEE